jgi:hypothetical protein
MKTKKFAIRVGEPHGGGYTVVGHKLPDGRFLTIGTAEGSADDLWSSIVAYAPNGLGEIRSIENLGESHLTEATVNNAKGD